LSKHTLYFELLEAMHRGGCPVCHLSRAAVRSHIEGLLHELVTDPAVRLRLRASRGFCSRHAREVLCLRSISLGAALAYRDVIKVLRNAINQIETRKESSQRGPWRRGTLPKARQLRQRLEEEQPCPVCATEEKTVQHAIDVLLEHICEDEIVEAFRASGGLCLAHFVQAAERAQSEKIFLSLVSLQKECYESLIGELDEFIRKNDYRYQEETMGTEATAWLRAIALLVGEEPKREH